MYLTECPTDVSLRLLASLRHRERTRRPEAPRHIPFDQLTQLELRLEGDGSVAKAAAIGVAVGVGTFFGMLLILFATTSWD